ncbi:MAG: tetratricopeptide repeat protein [candidate division KSB1 bacterium]|nr:tetratricopeptide repeat protein [candidate division KSB1 bacterium]MDZ7304401.1 tetratricopeptide repeat protein [candidate division KSB1 bacterium]MDZ7313351.1 tetratricopeptide repeat protein [candidate division KSB1 bacterium]
MRQIPIHYNLSINFFQAHFLRALLFFCFLGFLAVSNGSSQTPQQNAVRLRLAQDYERVGQYDRAVEIYLALFNADPRNGGYYYNLKRLLVQLRRYDELVAAINRRLELVDDLNARVDLGDVEFKRGQTARAQDLWNALLQKYPQPGTFAAVANALVDNRAYEEALQMYLQARQQLHDPSLFILELANLHALRANYAAATAEYLRYLETNPRQYPFIQSKVNEMARDEEKNLAAVAKAIQQALPQSSQPQLLHRLLAGLFMQGHQYAPALQAYQTLERLRTTADQANIGSEIFSYAEQARNAGAFSFAEQAYQIIVRDMPNSPYWLPAQFGLGQSLQAQGKYAEAQAAFATVVEKAAAGRNPWALRGLLAQGEILADHLHDVQAAIAVYTQIYNRFALFGGNERLEALFRLGDCHLALGDLPQAAKWYETARQLGQNSRLIVDKVNYRQARLAFFQGRFHETKKSLESIVNAPPDESENESMVNDALELLLLLDANMADSAGALLSYAHAEYATAQYNHRAAIDTLEYLLRQYPQADIAPRALFNLGNLYAGLQKFDAAIERLYKILNHYPESVVGDRALFRLAEIHEIGLADLPKAQALYEQLLKDYPQSLFLEEARRRARTLAQKNKSS